MSRSAASYRVNGAPVTAPLSRQQPYQPHGKLWPFHARGKQEAARRLRQAAAITARKAGLG